MPKNKLQPQKKVREVKWIRPKCLAGSNNTGTVRRKSVDPNPVRMDQGVHYPSADSGSMNTARADKKVYTGTLVKGLGQLHKSNLVPILNKEEATDIARMRRN